MFAIIGKAVVALLMLGVAAIGVHHVNDARHARLSELSRIERIKYVRLNEDNGNVTLILASTLMDKDGRLPNIITFQGKTYERGWTNEGNTDADEREWFEVVRQKDGK